MTDLDPTEAGPPLARRRVISILNVVEPGPAYGDLADGAIFRRAIRHGVFLNGSTLEPELFAAGLGRAMGRILRDELSLRPATQTALDGYRRVHLDRNTVEWETDPNLARITEAYEAALRREGLIDFDDLVIFGNRLIADHDWVLPAMRARWPVLAVDEYQDLGVPLHRIVTRLAFDGGVRLFAVGDADQSVYGFTGADGGLLLELAARDDVEKVRLELNYRSAGRIIRASELALGEARGYRPKDAGRQAVIEFIERPGGLEDQASYVAETITPAALRAKPGRSPGDIAIL